MSDEITLRDMKFAVEFAWMNLDNIQNIDAKGPLWDGIFNSDSDMVPIPLLETLNNPDYFYFFCKHFLNIHLLPYQAVILQELWNKAFPMFIATRGGGKSFLLAVYAVMHAFLKQGSKIVICGAGFRQSKLVFDYCETIWNNAPILRTCCGNTASQGPKHMQDMYKMMIGDSSITALPIGNGEKIRGQRATVLMTDEFHAVPRDIYEVVIGGFGVVTASPFENFKNEAAKKKWLEFGQLEEAAKIQDTPINKSIISGTASYQFNHFYDYFIKHKKIIESRGDERKLNEIFGDKGIPEGFNWKDYSIIRLPYDILPGGVMDKQNIAKARAHTHNTNFLLEYGAVFATDSNGFFKRSLIESCVVRENNLHFFHQGTELFRPTIRGNPNATYVYGIDPASETDNFSIVILELKSNHRRIIYSWTTNKKKHRDILAKNQTGELDYYSYCARKIRDLMRKFPCSRIALDSQGGGYSVLESLHDKDKMLLDEQCIWETIVPEKPKMSDNMAGLHLVELVNFADGMWTSKANHGMKQDFENKSLIFPFFDSILLEQAGIIDNANHNAYDTLEECVLEIEELKTELATIIHTQTLTAGRDRWDTPEIKLAGNKKGRMTKDRYSALLMANMVGREFQNIPAEVPYRPSGGFASSMGESKGGGQMMGPDWYQSWAKNFYQ